MQALFVYLLKVCLYSGILFLYYFIALRNKQFHYYNRFYLLMSVCLSLILPFLNFAFWQWHSKNEQVIQLMNVILVNGGEKSDNASRFYFSMEMIPLLLMASVAISLLTILCIHIIKIFHFRSKYPVEVIHNINFITTDLSQAPFSFFNNLFWKNTLNLNDTTGQQILKHEMTHIQEKHSWDKVFMRVITSLFWLNPVYWFIQKELSMIHEFIADEKAIEDKNAEAFAIMILQSQYSKMIFSPAQSFSYSPIKRRLLMLTTSRKPSFSYARRIAVLPLLAASVLLFAFKLKKDEQQQDFVHANAPFVLVVDAGHGGDEDGAVGINDIPEKNINLAIAEAVEQLAPGYGITVAMTRTNDATIPLENRVKFMKSHRANACISIHVSTTQEKTTDKNEMDVYVPMTGVNRYYEQSHLFGSVVLHAMKNDFPTNDNLLQLKQQGIYILDESPCPAIIIECGYMNNAESLKQLSDDAQVNKIAKDILAGVVAYANNKQQSSLVTVIDTTGKTPLYYVDGKEISAEEMKNTDPNRIESINVLKDSAAIQKYGDKGKNGVVLITMKTTNNKSAHIILDGNHYDSTIIPLYIIDGKESKAEISSIDPNNIESINVLKGDEGIKKYGDKGKNGVVLITLKTIISSNIKPVHPTFDEKHSDSTKVPLYVIDGKERSKAESDAIVPDKIESINVLQGDEAIKKYGDKGKNGVVEIQLKNGENKKPDVYLHSQNNTATETPASFPGGNKAWREYLTKQLHNNIVDKGPKGSYTVVVSFTVDENGNVSNVKALNDAGYGTADEAVRVIKSGPKWTPAQRDGKAITTETKQSITWQRV